VTERRQVRSQTLGIIFAQVLRQYAGRVASNIASGMDGTILMGILLSTKSRPLANRGNWLARSS